MLIDSHAHLNFRAFEGDADAVIRRCLEKETWVVNVGSQLETSRRAVELAQKYPTGVFASIGLHPIHVTGHLMKNKLDPEELADQENLKDFDIEDYRQLALSSWPRGKVVAIGEIGLDYYYGPKTRARLEEFKRLQKEALLAQMDLAEELGLPIIFHCRSAHQELIDFLKLKSQSAKRKTTSQNSKLRGVVHCFTGTIEQAREYLDLGLYLGFTGIIFRPIPGIDWPKISRAVPLEKILVETDSPYLIPPISLNQRLDQRQSAEARNEPLFVKRIVEEIAKIKKLSYEEVARATTQNARTLFRI